MKNKLAAVSILILLSQFLTAESFRVRKTHVIKLENENTEVNAGDCNIYDAAAIFLPSDRTFLEGIEIKLVIPETIASWPNCVAGTIYDRISPEPTPNQIDYSGTRLYVSALPGKLSWVIQVPLKAGTSITNQKGNKYSSVIDTIPSSQATNIFLKFQPVMKGIPEEVLNSLISVSAKPVLSNKGRLKLNLTSLSETPGPAGYSVFIDDIATDINKDIILDTGVHNLSIISENFRNEVRTFYIEQAKTTNLDIELKGVEPSVLITAPEGVKALLDGENCTDKVGKEFIITEGEHTIRFEIGSYEVVRSLTAIKGKTYDVSLDVDLSISEN